MSENPTPVVDVPATVKPGIKTTEFWLSTASTVFFALLSADVFPNTPVWVRITAIIAAVLSTLGYGASRSSVKQAAALLMLVLGLCVVGCTTNHATPVAPDLGKVIQAQTALLGVEFYVEDLHTHRKIGDKGYAAARDAELTASKALAVAANHARANTPLSADDQAAIAQSFRKVISTAILANNPELKDSIEIQQIETIIDEMIPVTTAPATTRPE